MRISNFDPALVPVQVNVDNSMIRVRFEGGLELATPTSRFPRLQDASDEQRKNWRLIGRGDGIHWPGVDEDISIRGLFFAARGVAKSAMDELPSLIADLYKTTERLNTIHDGRRPFTPDGHLVGSIGEVVAEFIYGLTLERFSAPGIDARTGDLRTVQIKLTGEKGTSYGFRWSNKIEMLAPDLLICLKLTKQGFSEIYNGPFPTDLLKEKSDQRNGQIGITVSRLRKRNPSLLPQMRAFENINRWFSPRLSDVA